MDSKRCGRCGQTTLAGLSNGGRSAALDVVLDPEPLTPIQELAALAYTGGRLCRTWTLHSCGDAHARTAAVILARPAGSTWRQTVHREHHCISKGER
jgi:hypothetical protein